MTLSKSYCVLTVKFDLFYLREEVEVLNVCTLDYSGTNLPPKHIDSPRLPLHLKGLCINGKIGTPSPEW